MHLLSFSKKKFCDINLNRTANPIPGIHIDRVERNKFTVAEPCDLYATKYLIKRCISIVNMKYVYKYHLLMRFFMCYALINIKIIKYNRNKNKLFFYILI